EHRAVGAMNTAELHTSQIAWHADDAAGLEEYFRRQGRDETVDRRWPLQRLSPEPATGAGAER
ncbi:MAG: hypothetical protein ACRD0P_18360, partial [Stackebrandtia sp.]